MGFLNETGLARFWQHIVTKLGEKLNISDAVGRKGEGDYSEIFNNYAGNIASGAASHAEGHDTVAASDYQHVQGKYNIPDMENVYAHIVGNGSDSVCSNAHTVDWNGNGWFKGEIYVGGSDQNTNAIMLAHQPLILEFTVPSSSLESGTEYNLGYKQINSTDIIEIKPDYTKDTSAEYREAIRNANFGARLGEIYDYGNGKVDYNFLIIPDGEIDTSIENYYFYVINYGKGGAW